MIDGEMAHQDSHGGGGLISNGDTQWMTAGAGILHIETPPEHLVVSGGLFHGFQLWVNLPKDNKWAAPRYQDIRGGEVALLCVDEGIEQALVDAGKGSAYRESFAFEAGRGGGDRDDGALDDLAGGDVGVRYGDPRQVQRVADGDGRHGVLLGLGGDSVAVASNGACRSNIPDGVRH